MQPDSLSIWHAEIARLLSAHQQALPDNLDALCAALNAVADQAGARESLAQRAEQARERYRRWLVAEGDRYSAILIGWPPGHKTPVHDHDDLWGIELVLSGSLHVDEFTVESGTPRPVRAIDLEPDHATIFDDAAYAHACSNPSLSTPALSLHVYGGPLLGYAVYRDLAGNTVERAYTATEPF